MEAEVESGSPLYRWLGVLTTSLGSLISAVSVLGFLGRFNWVLDLASHFRVQYMLVLCLVGGLSLLVRNRKAGLLFACVAALNGSQLLPLFMGRQKTSHGSNPRLRVMLLNVNTTTGNPALVKKEIQAADPDILVLEEINRRWIGELAWLKASHPHSITQPREDNFGIGVFSKQPLLDAKVVHLGLSIPSILAFLEIPGNRLRIVATHPTPPTSRDYARWRNKQLDLLPDALGTAAPVVLVGDLNVTPWNHYFRTLLKRTGLRDSAAGRGFQPTWPNTSSFFRIPIDHVLHSPDLAVVERRVGNDVDSDHFPVIVDFALPSGALNNRH